MSVQSIRDELSRLRNTEAALRKEAARHEADAGKARAAASDKRRQAANTKSPSMASSYLKTAEGEDKKAAVAADKLAAVSDKLAKNHASQVAKQASLASAEKSEQQAAERLDQRRRAAERSEAERAKRDQAAADRAAEQRRRKEKEHAREIGRLAQTTVRHVYVPAPKPEMLRVLYLTAAGDPDGSLRTDAEVNNVLKALRGAKHRDMIDLIQRPAASPQDLVDGINDHRPHVIHFSGHGGGQALALDNASLEQHAVVGVSFDVLGRLLSATDTPPTLLVMNACHTLEGSEQLLEAVPIIIAMADSVGDMAAGVFATQFYAAIASAQSVGAALRQAKGMMEVALLDDADLPQHVARTDTNIDDVVLVRPTP